MDYTRLVYTKLMATAPINLGQALKFQNATADTAYTGVGSLINNILPNVYIAGGVVIFFMIIIGGFTIIANAGDSHKIQETITSAIIGFAVLFASYWIIQIIQVVTGVPILNSSL